MCCVLSARMHYSGLCSGFRHCRTIWRYFPLSFTLFERGERRVTRVFCPARSQALATGAAGRREDGRGARCSCINSSYRLVFSLEEFGDMPVVGVMPMGGKLLEHASCIRWISTELLRLELLRWSEPVAGGAISVEPPLNKLASSLVRGRAGRLKLASGAVMAAERKRRTRGRLMLADRVRAKSRWSSRCWRWRLPCGRWPAVNDMPPPLLAEGRHPYFLPAGVPSGRQICSRLKAMVLYHGSLVAPNGEVPGDGEVKLDRRRRTRSLFPFPVWGPSCKVQGLVCNFQFSQGPTCISCCLLMDE